MIADLLKNTVISLKQSLVYTLSLGDKELFHSNILGWLLENHNDKGIQPIVKLFINDELEIERVEREKNHFDLCVTCHKKDNEADKHFVIIENKFKSLPDKKQLERYEVVCQGKKNKQDNYTFILFAPQDSLRVFEKNRPVNWQTVAYEDLCKALSKAQFSLTSDEQKFRNEFLISYKKLLESLLKIISLVVTSASEENSPYLVDKEVLNTLKEIRLHDVYQKLYASTVQKTLNINAGKDWKSDIYFMNGSVLKWTYIPDNSNIVYGVEIQREKFCIFAETKDRTVLKQSEKKLSEYFESILNEIFEEGRINHKKDGRLNVYNKGIYKYQYAKIPADTTIKDLRKNIKIAMKKIEESNPS